MVLAKPKPEKRKRVKRPKKEVLRRKLERQADALCKQIVLKRDGFCVCPAPRNGHGIIMQPGHLISRVKESVKFDLRNVHCQCGSCNLLHEFAPERYTNWFLSRFGEGEYRLLVADSEEVRKLSIEELQAMISEMEEIHRRQEDKTFRPYFSQKQILSGEWRMLGGSPSGLSFRIENA